MGNNESTWSSLNAFACNVISYSEVNSRGYVVAIAINAFVCSVKSCSEVSSRGYLVASDDTFVCSVISYFEVKRAVFENWFTTPPPKEQELGGKDF